MALRRTLALRLRADAPLDKVAAFQRAMEEAPRHMPFLLDGRVGKNIVSRRYPGYQLTWDSLFQGRDSVPLYMDHPYHKDVLATFFGRQHPNGIVEGFDSVYYEPRRVVVKEPGIRDCIKRSLVIAVEDGTPPEHTDTLERMLADMARYMPSIINWGMNRSLPVRPGPWTLVWEQEFYDLDGYRAYGAHPYHWGPLDDWFDHERPGHIVVKTFQVFYPTGSTVLGWTA